MEEEYVKEKSTIEQKWNKHRKKFYISLILLGLYGMTWGIHSYFEWKEFKADNNIMRLYESDLVLGDEDIYLMVFGSYDTSTSTLTVESKPTFVDIGYFPYLHFNEPTAIDNFKIGDSVTPEVANLVFGNQNPEVATSSINSVDSLNNVSSLLGFAGIGILLLGAILILGCVSRIA